MNARNEESSSEENEMKYAFSKKLLMISFSNKEHS